MREEIRFVSSFLVHARAYHAPFSPSFAFKVGPAQVIRDTPDLVGYP